jgi:hypothetical protein
MPVSRDCCPYEKPLMPTAGWVDWLRLINGISRIDTDNKLLTSSNVNAREPNRARLDKVHGFANLTRQ